MALLSSAGRAATSKASGQFLKDNAKFLYGGGLLLGGLGAAFTAGDFNKNIKSGDTVFKALLKTVYDFLKVRVALIGTFTLLGAAVRSIVKDTGSLDAALKRLANIQNLQRVFTPLVGGAKEAKHHVAELLTFSARTPFSFEGVAEADRSLQGLTKGAFAGTGALKTIGDAAAASGNGIEQSAQAVGGFYEALHNGEPIANAVEQLQQMGLVSDLTAQHLQKLSESGASSVEMANSLTRALEESRGGMTSYAKDLEAVGTAHEKAVENAKAALGEGFTQPSIQNTKNYTAAILALTPALEQVGKFLSGFTQTFETWGSKLVKAAAQSGILGGAIKVLTTGLTAGAIALTLFGTAAIPVVGPFLAIGVALATTGLILYKFSNHSKEAARELKELNKAHRESQSNIDAHGASIQSLTDLQEQYGRSVQHIIDLQNELSDAEKKHDAGKIKEIIRAIEEAKVKMGELPAPQQLASKERGDVIRERLEERRMNERSRFQESIEEHPGDAPQLHQQRAEVLEQRAEAAGRGLQTRQKIAEANAENLPKRSELQLTIASLEKNKEEGKLTDEQKGTLKQAKSEFATIEGKMLSVQEKQGAGASVGLEAQAQRLEHAQRANILEKQATGLEGEKKKDKQTEAKEERIMSGGVQAGPETGRKIQDIKAQAQELAGYEANRVGILEEARGHREAGSQQTRAQAVGTEELGIETKGVQALMSGKTEEQQKFQDLGSFLQNFEQLRQTYKPEDARQMALQKVNNDVMEKLSEDIKPVGDSLTRVGGGGGVSGPTGDRAQMARDRMAALQKTSIEVLQRIAENTAKAGTPEPGGGAGNPITELPPGAPGTPENTEVPATNPPEKEWTSGGAVMPEPQTEKAKNAIEDNVPGLRILEKGISAAGTLWGKLFPETKAQENLRGHGSYPSNTPAPTPVPTVGPVTAMAESTPPANPAPTVAPVSVMNDLANIPTREESQPEPAPVSFGTSRLPRVEPMAGTVGTKDNPLPQSQAMIDILNKIHNANKQSNDHLEIISDGSKDSGKTF